jgi:hypothetical protein
MRLLGIGKETLLREGITRTGRHAASHWLMIGVWSCPDDPEALNLLDAAMQRGARNEPSRGEDLAGWRQ